MTEVQAITDPNVIAFPKLGIKFEIDPTAFTLFGIDVQWYGVIITFGLVLALAYCMPHMRRFGIDGDKAIDAIIGGILGGIVGARIYYVALRWDDYKGDIKAILNTRNGGLAIYGGIIGSVAVGLLVCKLLKIKMLPMLDISMLGFLIGQGIGRWGNFVNQEAFGSNTDSIFGMTGGRIQQTIYNNSAFMSGDMYQKGIEISEKYAVHPCFLYESVWCLLGFAILAFCSRHRKYDGQILLMYLSWYGAERFVVEGLRTDSLMIGNIRISQALSAVIFVTSVILQIILFFKYRRDPEKFVLYASTQESHMLIEEARRKRMGVSAEDSHISKAEMDEIGILPDEDDDEDDDSLNGENSQKSEISAKKEN